MAYPTLSELVTEVNRVVQASSYATATITQFLNDGLEEISGRIRLPSLFASSAFTATTDASYGSLPSDYYRDLNYVFSSSNEQDVDIYPSYEWLRKEYMSVWDDTGDVTGVAIDGSNLHYQGIPSTAETIQLHYYTQPTLLSDDTDTPSCLPMHLARRILVAYCCKELFTLIEDGIDGQKTNTSYWNARFEQLFRELEKHVNNPVYPRTKQAVQRWL